MAQMKLACSGALRYIRLGALGCAALLGACEQGGGSPKALAFETLAEGTNGSGCEAQHDDRLIRTTADWQSYWDEVGEDSPLPDVDFSQHSVLATCGVAGNAYEFSTIEWAKLVESDAARVGVTDWDYGDGCCAGPAVMVYHYHAVRVEAVINSAEFVHTTTRG
jgi:hypothetical protein